MQLVLDKAKLLRENHEDCFKMFDHTCKFYLIHSKIYYVLVVNYKDPFNIEKLKFSTSGVLLSRIMDVKVNDDYFIRTRDNQQIIIKNNKVISSSVAIHFKPPFFCIKKKGGFR